jgi:hypothetical protein
VEDSVIDLAAHVGSRRKVRITRNRPSHRLINGYVLALQSGLVLLHSFDDFEPDGYAIIRERDVVGFRSNEYERLWDRMLQGEGLLAGLVAPPEIQLSDLPAAIRCVADWFRFMTIQCEDEIEDIQDFYLGEFIGVFGDTVHLRCVDALAQWEPQIAAIPLADITKVEFDTPYINHFTKYILE